jgi:hypothetical protein
VLVSPPLAETMPSVRRAPTTWRPCGARGDDRHTGGEPAVRCLHLAAQDAEVIGSYGWQALTRRAPLAGRRRPRRGAHISRGNDIWTLEEDAAGERLDGELPHAPASRVSSGACTAL